MATGQRKYIFFCPRGILNSSFRHQPTTRYCSEGLYRLELSKLGQLMRLARDGEASLILASDWSLFGGKGEAFLRQQIHAHFQGRIADCIQHFDGEGIVRSHEINSYLRKLDLGQYDSYVILDSCEESDNNAGKFVKVDPDVGLTQFDFYKAIKILEENDPK